MLKEYIPGTAERRKRLLGEIVNKRAEDVLVILVFADGETKLTPAEWNEEYDVFVTPGGRLVKPHGEGTINRLYGSKAILAYAPSMGRISPEAAFLSSAIENGDVEIYDQRGESVDVDPEDVDLSDDRPLVDDDGNSVVSQPVADGGYQPRVGDVETDVQGFDAYQIRLSDAARYDPFPVTENEASTAVEIAKGVGQEPESKLQMALIGAAVGAGLVLLTLFAIWLMGQMGGDSGGGGGGTVLGLLRPTLGLVASRWGVV